MAPSTVQHAVRPIKTKTTRLLIISDTHNQRLFPSTDTDHAFREPLPKADVLLHTGDLTMIGMIQEYEKTIDMIAGIDAELKLVIAGNHDVSLDEDFYRTDGERMHSYDYDRTMPAKAQYLWKEKAREKGITYLEEGMHAFELKSGVKFKVGL